MDVRDPMALVWERTRYPVIMSHFDIRILPNNTCYRLLRAFDFHSVYSLHEFIQLHKIRLNFNPWDECINYKFKGDVGSNLQRYNKVGSITRKKNLAV